MQKSIITGGIIIIIGVAVFFVGQNISNNVYEAEDVVIGEEKDDSTATTTEEAVVEKDERRTIIGNSVEERQIVAYHYGAPDADKEILLVGGIHGGYSWNTALVAYEAMKYFEINEADIPDDIRITIIPVLNPDGLYKIVGTTTRNFTERDLPTRFEDTIPGRFNANNVDINRNFACDWEKNATWKSVTVSGGSEAFSEPESDAFRKYIVENNPSAVVVYYSSAGGVYASNCHTGVSNETITITNIYAEASGYPAYEEFDFYDITGDVVNWLASKEIAGISVLLSTHEDVEWDKNKKGIEALIDYYKVDSASVDEE